MSDSNNNRNSGDRAGGSLPFEIAAALGKRGQTVPAESLQRPAEQAGPSALRRRGRPKGSRNRGPQSQNLLGNPGSPAANSGGPAAFAPRAPGAQQPHDPPQDAQQRPAAPQQPGFDLQRRRGRPPRETAAPEGNKLRIIPLGGINEVGKNITAFEFGDDIFLLDCGIAFPDPDMLGVDLVLPDFTYVEKNAARIRGLIITHGHEDHIGGVPYLLKLINLPVYGTKLTIGLIEGKLQEHGILGKAKLNVIAPKDKIKFGCFTVEAIRVNHSIPDAVAFAIHTPVGVVVHTGDFKVDYTPIEGGIIDLARFGELGSRGVLALMSDSTNAERPGSTISERKIGASLMNLFEGARKKRVIVASFASNIHRVQQIIDAAVKYSRKVAVSGRSMENVVAKAIELGYLKVPQGVLVELSEMRQLPPGRCAIITTGSQGEPMSALSRMAMGDHRQLSVGADDLIIISATPIPGNEKTVSRVVNELMRLGASVIYERMYEIHVSGHAQQEEQRLLIGLTKPQFFIPVHGEQKHLRKHAELAESMGLKKQNVIIPDNGLVVELDGKACRAQERVPAGRVFVDGLGVGDVGNTVLRDRKHLGTDGIIIVSAAIDTHSGRVLVGPQIESRGFVYVKEADEILSEARLLAEHALANLRSKNEREWNIVKVRLRDNLSDLIYQRTKRSPMILPMILEVSG